MLLKIKRQQAIDQYPILPLSRYDEEQDELIFTSPRVFANYKLALPAKSFRGLQKILGTEITLLAKSLGADQLIFMGDSDLAWLRRWGQYENFQQAMQYLADHKVGKRFNGALQVSLDELPTFIKHLSWLVRTNGVVQYVHFTDPGQQVMANICQYGNLHISTKNQEADKLFKEIIPKSKFTYFSDQHCTNKFSKNNVIRGRTTTV